MKNSFSLTDIVFLIVIALAAGVFSIALALTKKTIDYTKSAKQAIIVAICVQFTLSIGVFFGVVLILGSEISPIDTPSLVTISAIAYFCAGFSSFLCNAIIFNMEHQLEALFCRIFNKKPREKLEATHEVKETNNG